MFGGPAVAPAPPRLLEAAREWLEARAEALFLGAIAFEIATIWIAAQEGFVPDAAELEAAYNAAAADHLSAARAETSAKRRLIPQLERGRAYRVDGVVFGLGQGADDGRVVIYSQSSRQK
jgi:hypothetical protein